MSEGRGKVYGVRPKTRAIVNRIAKKQNPRAYRAVKMKYNMQRNVISNFKRELVTSRRTLKLEYCTPINGVTTSAQGSGNPTVWHRFLLNNIYRPYSAISTNITPTTGIKNNSVQEYDTLSALYNKYIVYGALVEYRQCNLEAFPLVVGMSASCDTANIATTHLPSDIVSRDNVIYKTVLPGILGASTAEGQAKFRKYYSIPNVRGIKGGKVYKNNDDNGVSMGSTTTPGSVWLNLFLGGQSDACGSSGYQFDGMLKITFYLCAYDKQNEIDQPD